MHQSPDTGRLNLSTQAEGATTLERLREHIRTLVTVDETEAPMLSCYLGMAAGYRQGLQARVRALRRSLARHEREPFEEALSQIESFLDSGILPGTKGLAAFARGGSRPFFLPLQFQLPLPNRLSIDSTPNIYDLVEFKDTYHRYVVMIATEKRARILEVNLGAVTKEIWAERPELRQRVGREWTRDQYQNHSRDRADRFIKEKVEILDRLMSQGGQTHLILAGSPPLAARLRDALPKRLAAKLIDIIPASADANTGDVVAATLATFIEHEAQESVDTASLLLQEIRRNGLAVAGAAASLGALERGQVDVLLMAGAYEPAPGWRCRSCAAVEPGPDRPSACRRCGEKQVYPVDLKETMAKLAERHGATFELVRHSDVLMELGGVGCLLRYQWGRPIWLCVE